MNAKIYDIGTYRSYFYICLLITIIPDSSSQSTDSICSYSFEKEWVRKDHYSCAYNEMYTFFYHYLPDGMHVGYGDFDQNGIKYIDTAYSLLKRYHYNAYWNISPSVLDSLYLSTREKILSDSGINQSDGDKD